MAIADESEVSAVREGKGFDPARAGFRRNLHGDPSQRGSFDVRASRSVDGACDFWRRSTETVGQRGELGRAGVTPVSPPPEAVRSGRRPKSL